MLRLGISLTQSMCVISRNVRQTNKKDSSHHVILGFQQMNCLKCFSVDIVVIIINQQINSSATRCWHIILPMITQSVRHSRLQIKVNPHEANAKAEPIVKRKSLLLGLKDYWHHSKTFRSDVAITFAQCDHTIRLYRNVYIISEMAGKPG